MKTVPLTQGKVALVDDADYHNLNQFEWCATRSSGGRWSWYAMRHDGTRTVKMHRVLLGVGEGVEVNHIDGNGLNNCRSNLQACSSQENKRAFRRKAPGKFSKYRGVSLDSRDGAWTAQITLENKKRHLGRFESELEAAEAYDKAAIKHYGEFASPNFL